MSVSLWKDLRVLMAVPGYFSFFLFRTIKAGSGWVSGALMTPVMVYQFQATPHMMGVSSLLLGMPFIILGPYLGSLADRKSPVLFMVFGSLWRALLIGALAFAPTIEIFIALLFFNAVGGSASAAEPIVLRRLLNDDQIATSASVTTFTDQATKLAAPLIGASLMLFGTAQQGFLAIAILAFTCALCVLPLGRHIGWHGDKDAASRKRKKSLKALREILHTHPKVKATVMIAIGTAITMGMHSAVLIFMLRSQRLPEGAYGVHMSCTAAGALLCSLTLKKWLDGRDRLRVMMVCAIGFLATILVTGLWGLSAPPILMGPLAVIWIISGYFFAGKMMCYGVLLQTSAPPDRVGLVMASSQSLMLIILEITPLIGLAITEWRSAALAYVVSVVGGACFLLMPSARVADEPAQREAGCST